ncbi:MAG: hypothetical protein GC172_09240 [Phycisphaera sp.]|nr:hypothetical protein [Phycisphaera sp.]
MARGSGRGLAALGAAGGGRVARFLAATAAIAFMTGCPPKVAPAEASAEQSVELLAAERAEAERFIAACVAAQDERAAKLPSFEAFAAVRLRYTDENGPQEDQLDGAIFLAPGNKGAFDLKLLGERWAWLGGDGTSSWVFLAPPRRPSVLHVYERLVDGAATDAADAVGSAELTLLTPASLRLLLGIAPIGRDAETVLVGAAPAPIHERCAARFSPSATTRAEILFTAEGLPRRVVVQSVDGTEIVRADLANFERVRLPDVALGGWPAVPTSITMVAARSKAGATILIDKDRLQGVARRARPQFFDLGELQAYLMPSEVVLHAAEAEGAKAP